jgi:hypothetical protein
MQSFESPHAERVGPAAACILPEKARGQAGIREGSSEGRSKRDHLSRCRLVIRLSPGILRSQEEDSPGEIFGFAPSAQRNCRGVQVSQLGGLSRRYGGACAAFPDGNPFRRSLATNPRRREAGVKAARKLLRRANSRARWISQEGCQRGEEAMRSSCSSEGREK